MDHSDQTSFGNTPSPLTESHKTTRLIPLMLIIEGKDFGHRFVIESNLETVLVGRSKECDFIIHDPRASRKHFVIKKLEDKNNSYLLTDLNSTNGTFINGNRFSEKKIENGDKILVGQTLISYVIKNPIDIKFDEQVINLAMRDALTGLYNRDFFMRTLGNEFSRATRYNKNLSLLFIDIDFFKQVNDKFGHAVGDSVLKRLGYIITDSIRSQDIPARYGGEEFLLLLPEVSAEEATVVAGRIRRKMEREVFLTELGKFYVTISIGVSSFSKNMEKKEDLINIADANLYKAKHSGRNCVFPAITSYDTSPTSC